MFLCLYLLLYFLYKFLYLINSYNRWLQWIRSSGRLDLEEKGPEYSSKNCRLCSLHFEEKWFKISNRRILLYLNAVPIRFGKDLESFSKIKVEESRTDTEAEKDKEIEETIQQQTCSATEKENRKGTDKKNINIEKEIMDVCNKGKKMDVKKMDVCKIIPSTTMLKPTMTSKKKNSPTKKQLRTTIKKLRLKHKIFQQKLRRFQKRKDRTITTKGQEHVKEKVQSEELKILKTFGNKWLPEKFSMLLSVQIDAQTKSKRDIRYSNKFKKFALSMYFLSSRNYKELKKSFTLPSVRTLHSFTYN
ncbi:uncharacterized protein LOC118645817 [Monomorium pharaonis]|uniref:uncharacterized protein LOC118645817 n=1 Tax=Monomorium pharaonis TaxID=307658 RepID=UPI0017478177|nr:uncharacterized protein LOC118645817 [Monomorium pharaonis]